MSAFIGDGEAHGWVNKELHGSVVDGGIADKVHKLTLKDIEEIREEIARLLSKQQNN